MLCAVIKGPTLEDAQKQIHKAEQFADLIELRLDYFHLCKLCDLNTLQISVPRIFTLRDRSQGGSFAGVESERQKLLMELIEFKPDYIDLEHHLPPDFIVALLQKSHATKLILSYHNFEICPLDIETIFQKLSSIPAHCYKIAVMSKSSCETLRLLSWSKDKKLISIAMGSLGQPGRILAKPLGSPIVYASLEEHLETAPGQMTLAELTYRYRVKSLDHMTQFLGLIGDPVDKSLSHDCHNDLIKKQNWNAVYVKMRVQPNELEEFLNLAKQIPFRGLSVTMPLKEVILPFLDQIDCEAKLIGAVNTLDIKNGIIKGYNTDGKGALLALEAKEKVEGKHIVLIGAGGATKAIAFDALKRKARVTVLNRSVEKAKAFAEQFKCSWGSLDQLPDIPHDILINCTSAAMPIPATYFRAKTVVMDIKSNPKMTPFLTQAQEKQLDIVYGYEMFIEQAVLQFMLWFPASDPSIMRKILLTKICYIFS